MSVNPSVLYEGEMRWDETFALTTAALVTLVVAAVPQRP